ncbi:type II toxin-antitoxin system VapB family antitoxin [Rhodanobacter lindaniclasticus]
MDGRALGSEGMEGPPSSASGLVRLSAGSAPGLSAKAGLALRCVCNDEVMHVRTNIVIDDTLMRDALRATGLKTKREAVELGLQTLLRLKHGRNRSSRPCAARSTGRAT